MFNPYVTWESALLPLYRIINDNKGFGEPSGLVYPGKLNASQLLPEILHGAAVNLLCDLNESYHTMHELKDYTTANINQ